MAFVLDASLALAWHFEDEGSAYADRVLGLLAHESAVVPSVWPLEIANGLAVAERRGRLMSVDVLRAAHLFLELPLAIREVPASVALGPVLELARDQGLTAYDAAYLSLALHEGLPLATEDRELRAGATRVGVELLT
ncbi:MAG: type II toxin-antitoxin system VapC family toxin [Dehalococcoidia bacterium]